MRRPRRAWAALLTAALLATSACTAAAPAPTTTPTPTTLAGPAAASSAVQVGLRVLVLDDGDPTVAGLVAAMERLGTSFDRVLLRDVRRPALDAAALATTDADGVHARYAGIIAPRLDHPALSASERGLLAAYRDAFGVRLLRTSTEALPAASGVTAGEPTPVDGVETTLTPEALGGSFSYLAGPVTFDTDPGYPTHATPLRARTQAFAPLLNSDAGALLGVLADGDSEDLLLAFEGDRDHTHVQTLAPGMLSWLTRGLSTSVHRNWFSVHSDDILLPNAQWSIEGHCEIGRNCPPGVPQLDPIRMTADDITHLVDWQRRAGIVIDIAFNGAGAGEYAQNNGGRDPLMEAMVTHTDEIRLLNHTWGHLFLGCQQIVSPDDWRCAGDEDGEPVWRTEKELYEQVAKNKVFATKNNLANFDPSELVTGEHSGLAKPPHQMTDNPHLAAAITRAGIAWVASDASDESEPRRIGSALTVPRHPIDLEFSAATKQQVADEHNWRLTSTADGGSGQCERDPYDSCAEPMSLETGFDEVVVPSEGDKAWRHTIANDARPHFAHQSNMTADRVLYPVLDHMLDQYRRTFSAQAPLVNPTMAEAGQVMVDQHAWALASDTVEATVSNGLVRLTNRGSEAVAVPLTLPEGSERVAEGRLAGAFGEAYAGARSDWVLVEPGAEVALQAAGETGFPDEATWPGGEG